jgi:hypothetical protein
VIRVVVAFLFRCIVDFGLVLVATGLVFFVVAFRLGRRFFTPEPDKLDRVSSELARLLSIGLVAARRASLADGDELGELDDPGVEQADFYGEVDWRELVI